MNKDNDLIRRGDARKMKFASYKVDADGIYVSVYDIIDNINAVPAVEQPKGKWEEIDRDVMGEKTLQCGKCGKRTKSFFEPNFCPNCGAEMMKEETE